MQVLCEFAVSEKFSEIATQSINTVDAIVFCFDTHTHHLHLFKTLLQAAESSENHWNKYLNCLFLLYSVACFIWSILNVNVCTKCNGNPSNSRWDISLKTTDQPAGDTRRIFRGSPVIRVHLLEIMTVWREWLNIWMDVMLSGTLWAWWTDPWEPDLMRTRSECDGFHTEVTADSSREENAFKNLTAARWLSQGDRGKIWLVKQREWMPIISWQRLKQKEGEREEMWMNERIESLPDWTFASLTIISAHQKISKLSRA